jgi:hypothetical protein
VVAAVDPDGALKPALTGRSRAGVAPGLVHVADADPDMGFGARSDLARMLRPGLLEAAIRRIARHRDVHGRVRGGGRAPAGGDRRYGRRGGDAGGGGRGARRAARRTWAAVGGGGGHRVGWGAAACPAGGPGACRPRRAARGGRRPGGAALGGAETAGRSSVAPAGAPRCRACRCRAAGAGRGAAGGGAGHRRRSGLRADRPGGRRAGGASRPRRPSRPGPGAACLCACG